MRFTIYIGILMLLLFTKPDFIHAQKSGGGTAGGPTPCPPNELCDPLGIGATENAPQQLIGRVISSVLGIVGSLALLMFVYGGFLWMTSGGNKENVDKGRQVLIWATIGLALIFFSYVIVRFTIQSLTGQNTQNSIPPQDRSGSALGNDKG